MKKIAGLALIVVFIIGASFLYVRGSGSHSYIHTGLTTINKPPVPGPLLEDGSMCVSVSVVDADGQRTNLPSMQTHGVDLAGLSEEGKVAMASAMRDAIIEQYNATLMQQGNNGLGLVSEAIAQPKCKPGECGGSGDCSRLCYGHTYLNPDFCIWPECFAEVNCWHFEVCSPCNYLCYLPCCPPE